MENHSSIFNKSTTFRVAGQGRAITKKQRLSFPRKLSPRIVKNIGARNGKAVSALIPEKVKLGLGIIGKRAVMIQMLFVNIKQNGVFRRFPYGFKHVGGHFKNVQPVGNIREKQIQDRSSNIPHSRGIKAASLKHMCQKRRGSAFALGTGNADNTVFKSFNKKLCLACNTVLGDFIINSLKGNARTFKNRGVACLGKLLHIMFAPK